jgi:hypothetical protein
VSNLLFICSLLCISLDLVMVGSVVNFIVKLNHFLEAVLLQYLYADYFPPIFYSVFDCFSPSESGAGTELELGGDDGHSASASASIKRDSHSGRWYIYSSFHLKLFCSFTELLSLIGFYSLFMFVFFLCVGVIDCRCCSEASK